MHFNNYINLKDAMRCAERRAKEVTVTPTAVRQTPESTLQFLEKNGVKVREIRRSGRPRKLSDAQVRKIVAMRQSDVSFYKIARITGVAKSTVFDYYRRNRDMRIQGQEIRLAEIDEAHKVLKRLMKTDIDEEISELARRGYNSNDVDEITQVMAEIEEIIKSMS